ncbi:hypothetical protein LOK49_LG04G01220 [Camellia lanceoleosa]|uniref:Uncharacterized protein n=1 Tax=Camellia lanceoleosa TaxID=1840588 RepID=A0ACC0I4Q2_9ERIC|nr:hypothetical protein LOK49_LG04G01220 [Camellia lanceoleosa]
MEPSVLDFQERDIGHLAGREAKIQFVHSPDFANCHFANGSTDTFGSDTEHPGKPHTSDQHCDEERGNGMQYHANVSHPKKSGKGSSSWSKEKNGSSKSELDKGKVKISESIDHTRYEEKSGARKNKVQEKLGVNSDKVEKNFMGKKESAGEVASRLRPRLDYSDPAAHAHRYQDSFGAGSSPCSHDYYGSDYGEDSYSFFYGNDHPYGGGYYY